MGDVILFPLLARGEVVGVELEGVITDCKVMNHEGDYVYKMLVMEGKYKNEVIYLHLNSLQEMDSEIDE